jgi:hypothetical protein
MRVLGSVLFAQASIRAWRLEPLPEIRTVRLCCDSAIVGECGEECKGMSVKSACVIASARCWNQVQILGRGVSLSIPRDVGGVVLLHRFLYGA